MKKKKIMCLLIAASMCLSGLTGCGEKVDEPETVPTEPSIEANESDKQLDDALGDIIDFGNPEDYDDEKDYTVDVDVVDKVEIADGEDPNVEPEEFVGAVINPAEEHGKMIWEKTFSTMGINVLSLTSNWNKSIAFGGANISSTTPTDLSVLPNYFFNETNPHADVETAYYIPHLGYRLEKLTQLGANITGLCEIDLTTSPASLNIERVSYTLMVNPYEGGYKTVRENTSYDAGTFGLGSTYKEVMDILGEPGSKLEHSQGDYKLILVGYMSDDAYMQIEFSHMSDEPESDAIVTMITWNASTVYDTLRTQEEIETFIGYIPPEVTEETESE